MTETFATSNDLLQSIADRLGKPTRRYADDEFTNMAYNEGLDDMADAILEHGAVVPLVVPSDNVDLIEKVARHYVDHKRASVVEKPWDKLGELEKATVASMIKRVLESLHEVMTK